MGLHDTLEKVLSLYEAMAGTADRAVKRVEEFEARVAGLVRTVNETAQTHEARLKEAYRRPESMVDQTRMVFWFSRMWIFLLVLMCAGFMGAMMYHLSRVFTGWVGEIDIELVGRVSLLSLLPVADLGESYNRLQNEAKVVELWSLPGL